MKKINSKITTYWHGGDRLDLAYTPYNVEDILRDKGLYGIQEISIIELHIIDSVEDSYTPQRGGKVIKRKIRKINKGKKEIFVRKIIGKIEKVNSKYGMNMPGIPRGGVVIFPKFQKIPRGYQEAGITLSA